MNINQVFSEQIFSNENTSLNSKTGIKLHNTSGNSFESVLDSHLAQRSTSEVQNKKTLYGDNKPNKEKNDIKAPEKKVDNSIENQDNTNKEDTLPLQKDPVKKQANAEDKSIKNDEVKDNPELKDKNKVKDDKDNVAVSQVLADLQSIISDIEEDINVTEESVDFQSKDLISKIDNLLKKLEKITEVNGNTIDIKDILQNIKAKLEGSELSTNQNVLIQKIEVDNKIDSIKKLFAQLKQACNSLSQKINTDASKASQVNAPIEGDSFENLLNDTLKDKQVVEEEKPEQKINREDTSDSQFGIKEISVKNQNVGDSQLNNSTNIIGEINAKNPQVEFASSLNKTETTLTQFQKSDVLNQVIENAKATITEDKSEMVMDLKPESLGKLSLKIVTERGEVMAKFVAENQQVKAILESNMQMLKDSLEKQGFSVQGFSVSVGQENKNNFAKDFSQQERSYGTKKGNLASNSNAISESINESRYYANKGYQVYQNSSINLTA